MSEYSITQEQIENLLNEVSIEDRVRNQFAKVKNKISRMLQTRTSRDLMKIKKDLGTYMKTLENNRPYSLDFIDSFKAEYKTFSKQILQITREYALFELVVKLENMIGAMFFKVEQERRRYPRFPLLADLLLSGEDGGHTVFGADISSVGISFYAPVQLEVGRRITLSTPAPQNEQLTVDVLRVIRIEPEQLNIWRTACAFPNLLSWERIRDIITGAIGTEK
jgi:hypothetical protein